MKGHTVAHGVTPACRAIHNDKTISCAARRKKCNRAILTATGFFFAAKNMRRAIRRQMHNTNSVNAFSS